VFALFFILYVGVRNHTHTHVYENKYGDAADPYSKSPINWIIGDPHFNVEWQLLIIMAAV
jgi:hypothetical protein